MLECTKGETQKIFKRRPIPGPRKIIQKSKATKTNSRRKKSDKIGEFKVKQIIELIKKKLGKNAGAQKHFF